MSKDFFIEAARVFCTSVVLDNDRPGHIGQLGFGSLLGSCLLLRRYAKCVADHDTIKHMPDFRQYSDFSNLKTITINIDFIDIYHMMKSRERHPCIDVLNDDDFKRMLMVKYLKKIRGLESITFEASHKYIGVQAERDEFTQNVARLQAYLLPFVTASKPTIIQRDADDAMYPGSRVSLVQSTLLAERRGGHLLRPRANKHAK